MNRFNEVFLIIRKRCEQEQKLAEIRCFETVAKEANVPLTQLHIYLDHLKELGLIQYSMEDKYIYLTAFGKKQKTHTAKE